MKKSSPFNYKVIDRCDSVDEYKGIVEPTCGGGHGCNACWEKWYAKHPLPKKVIRSLEKQVVEMKDKIRFLVVSSFSKTFNLYYCVDSNTFMNEMNKCTRFKDVKIAKAVAVALSDGKKRTKDLQIWKVKESKNEKSVKFVNRVGFSTKK